MCGKPSTYAAVSLLAGLLLTGTNAIVRENGVRADEGETRPAARADRLGDPLPSGAVARLGSSRFRGSGWTRSLVFGPDDRTLLAYGGGQVVTWERTTGKPLRRFAVPAGLPSSFSPDGTALALVDGKEIRIWDTADGKELRKLPAPDTRERTDPVFSPDGAKLAAVGAREVILYDRQSAKVLHTLAVPGGSYGAAFSPDGRYLLVAPRRGPAQFWDVAGVKRVRDLNPKRDFFWRAALAFSPDGKTVAMGHFHSASVAEVSSGRAVSDFGLRSGAHSLVFTADGRDLIIGQQGYGVQIWDPIRGKKKADLLPFWVRRPVLALSGMARPWPLAMPVEGTGKSACGIWTAANRPP